MMEQYKNLCQSCGGDLRQISETEYKCEFCGTVFDGKAVMRYADELRKLLDELKIEAISNARRNLYEAVNAEYVSSRRVHECCVILKQLLPDDFQANFYEVATGNNVKQLTRAIRKINVEENFVYVEGIIRFLLRSFQTEYQLELNNLIAKAYEKTDPQKFEQYCTELSVEAVKVDNGVYETKLPREVFVAYSSKDMDKVSELTEALESQGLKCFVAARNLRHGKGAVENYNRALEEAMDHCRSIVFVSSVNSRSFNCDALTIELPYIQKKDTENAPAEYKNNYKAMPQQYKKPRVEYRIGESVQNNIADKISDEIFDGYERAYSPEEVAVRVIKQLVAAPAASTKKQEAKVVKYCVSCLAECPQEAKFCMECGGKEFAASREAAELKQQILALEKQKAELEKAKGVEEPKAALTVKPAPQPEIKPTPKPEAKPAPKPEINGAAGLEFKLNSDGTGYSVTSIGKDQKDTQIVIPAIYNGKAVTSIGNEAFRNCTSLKSITIPNSVTSIGDSAFRGCSSLTSITIPDSVTSIGRFAFMSCVTFTSIKLPGSVTSISESAFQNCHNLKSITIPDSVANIDKNAFAYCYNLYSITISDSVTSIGGWAFAYCRSLKSITIPTNVINIGSYAFYNLESLDRIIFENPVGWRKVGRMSSYISKDTLSDPQKAAEALTKTYVSVSIERV